MRKALTGYLWVVFLGLASWSTQAKAIGMWMTTGPTCDEITSGYICDGTFVPEVVVTAPRIWHPHPRIYVPALAGLSSEELNAFIAASLAAILAARNHADIDIPSSSAVLNRQSQAAKVMEYRDKVAKIDQWVVENSPSCEAIHDYAALLGMFVVTGSSLTVPVSFPGIVVGMVVTTGATLSKHYYCT